MKFSPVAALGLVLAALTTPVLAEDTAATATAAAAFTLDTPIEALVADERAKAVLVKHLPGIDQHPAFEQFKTLSLKALAPFSQGMITDDMLAKIEADLTAIK
ncbi:hypothetical protein C0V72_01525 [Porphyrobacter sp. TH134]|uniref:hypothetical protein n=1 Tax=Porphyrobacter sp. TH134 TaxID=2067450 RepID=UPI000C7B0121|nr:hypothetical protein [Porphyrobacter sp. TH134]PLK25339.1 hypothetical protein C0V72_01525 [Porphyrobacter sp. TH134]